ncbi:hypothetical protein EB24_00365 [Enterococcus hirae]|uniref:hypothetical protein n=2 Tax=Enterococcus hirae TaxID=1354 RepID=UPI000DEB4E62|nr:hypothetical protein [Enterococcus hirae]RBT57152.1 hypothetical protein EB24_00365 [Enterococcus hirae]RBT63780.1 hypothetical protein EB39_00215 [Enterococcus hirae]ROZ12077.1 hypothetical protein EGX06_10730 [Enterococcus hirae]
MNQEKVKNTILMEMERFSDKTSEGYHQMKAVLNKFPYKITADYQQLLDTLRGGTAINRFETLDELIMMLKQERVITREIVESCLYFQQNSDNVINQIHLFDLLMVPTRNLTEQLNLLTSLTNSLSVDGEKFFHENVLFSINKIKLSTDEIEKKIKEICIELQYGMDSAKVKEDILARTFELLNEGSVNYQQLVNMELDYEEGCREIVIDGFFETMNRSSKNNEYKWFFDFLRDDKIISKLLQRKNLSEAEKKTYISIATNHSDSPFIGNSIPYFKKINLEESTIITKKRILDQELVYLIAKEVTPELAVKYDEILRGEEQGTVEVMTQIYVESQSTLVKESVRQHVNTSFKETDRLEFYKKSIIEKLKKENRSDLGDQLEDLLNSGAKIDRFDRFYRLLNSPESKKQLSYLGRLVFGENQWHKFETVQAFKEELKETEAKKNSSLSEMMKKDLSEIENQRHMNGLRSIDNKLANNDYLKQLKPEQIATIMLQLKVNYPNWTEKNFEQVNNQLSTYLNEEDKIQTNKILNEKEVILRISAISMEMGEKAQTIILAPIDKIKGLDIVGEVRKDLKKQKVDYLFPIILETINHTLSEEGIDCSNRSDREKALNLLQDYQTKKEILPKIEEALQQKKEGETLSTVIYSVMSREWGNSSDVTDLKKRFGDDGEGLLKETKDLSQAESLLQSIKEALRSQNINFTESDVINWTEKCLSMDEKKRQSESQVVINKIKNSLLKIKNKKNTKQVRVNKVIETFQKDLNNKKEEIKKQMKYSVIEVYEFRDDRLSIEEQFSNILNQKKEIQHFIHTYPKLKSVIDECSKQIPLVSVDLKKVTINEVESNNNKYFKNLNKVLTPFEREWWQQESDKIKQFINTYVSPKNLLVSDVNRQIEELLIKDEHCCSQVVLSFLVYSSGVFKNINPKYTAGYLNKDSEYQQNRWKIKRLVESFEKLHSHRQEMKQLKELNIDVEQTPMPQGTSNQSLISNSVKEPERKKEQPKEKSEGIEPTLTPLGISNHSLTDKQTKTPLVIKNQTFEEQMNQSTNVADSLNQEKSAGIQPTPIPKEIRDQSLTNKSPQTANSHPVIKIQTLEERMNQSTNKANNLNEMKEAGKNQSSVRELKN